MAGTMITLDQLSPQQTAHVHQILIDGSLRQRLDDLGLIEGTRISCRMIAPGGSPAAYEFRGAVVALRRCDASRILCAREDS